MPHSINLSRSDFDMCDIVEEVRRRVDDSGLPRNIITIEITESAIGSDFDFMKQEIARFQQLGFPVWMDDFGSGYSSLDVLQSIKFDLIKFDMIFMKKLDDGESGKIVLSELMRMATSLGVDTVCEGVETKEQQRFLQEIGCSKLQGYYYTKPIPLESILERYEKGIQIGYENPLEAEYYDTMGRINLYDMTVIASEDDNDFNNVFNTVPMCIMEIKGTRVKVVRSNKSYRKFMVRFFDLNLSRTGQEYNYPEEGTGSSFMNIVTECCESGGRVFFDEQMPDGSTIHTAIRRISQNPVTGKTSIAIAVLSIRSAKEGASYANIARALAADYYNIYYVDLSDDSFIEYSSPVGEEELAVERHGVGFFDSARTEMKKRIFEDDYEFMSLTFTKDNILKEIDEQGSYIATYRLMDTGSPVYVNMKAIRMQQDRNHLIIGISVVDSQMKQQEMIETIQREKTAYARIMALTGGYLCLYTVNPETGRYFEYSTSEDYDSLGLSKTGEDFFGKSISYAKQVIFEDDIPDFMRAFTLSNVLREIRKTGSFRIQYRLVIKGISMPVISKIVSVKESDGEKLIVGVRFWRERH